jgi:hypothetical protein
VHKDILGEASTGYGTLLSRLTVPEKPREVATIRAFCDWRDPAATGAVCHLGPKTWGRPEKEYNKT